MFESSAYRELNLYVMITLMSQLNNALLSAYQRGYRVNDEGVLLKPSGDPAYTLKAKGTMGKGYLRSGCLHVPGHKRNLYFFVHRLAAYQWFGEVIFRPGIQVRHLNGDSFDNRRENIAIGSQSENMQDIPHNVRVALGKNAAKHLRALSQKEAQNLIDEHKNGASYSTLMAKYGIAKGTVSHIVNGKTYPELNR